MATASIAKSSPAFLRFAGVCGVITAISSLLYAVFFLLVKGSAHDLLPPLLLGLGGLLASAVLTALYGLVRDADPLFALWALALRLLGQLGALIYGVHDLALVVIPAPTNARDLSGLPNQLDPRGRLAFGLTGVSTFILSWLVLRGEPCRAGWATSAARWASCSSCCFGATSSPTIHRASLCSCRAAWSA